MGANLHDPSLNSPARRNSLGYTAAAIALVALWALIYAPHADLGICDEPGHWGVIEHFRDGRPGWPETLPHPPGYHYVVLALTAGHPSPTSARIVTALFAVLAIVAFNGAWRAWHGRPAGAHSLLFVLLPILQPYTAMIYTDVPALALVLVSWWAQLTGRRWIAGIALAAACCIRQTSVIWGTCFMLLDLMRAPGAPQAVRERVLWAIKTALQRTPGLLLVHLAVLAVVLWAGRFTPGSQHGNALQPNPATLFFAAVLLFALTAPLWFMHVAAFWKNRPSTPIARRRVVIAIASGCIATAVLASWYRNPHVWNRELWWPDTPFTLLRNWPLVAADQWPWVRWAISALVVVGGTGAAFLLRMQPLRRDLAIVLVFSAVLLATNGLVEPRYFITPAVLCLFFIEMSSRTRVVLGGWFIVVNLAVAPLIYRNLALW